MSDCINHPGPYDSSGYGRVNNQQAHRVAWRLVNGPIPKGMTVDHVCENRRCVNVDHLRLLTLDENVRARQSFGRRYVERPKRLTAKEYAERTECANGHEWNDINVRIDPRGYPVCRPCQADSQRASKARYRERAGY